MKSKTSAGPNRSVPCAVAHGFSALSLSGGGGRTPSLPLRVLTSRITASFFDHLLRGDVRQRCGCFSGASTYNFKRSVQSSVNLNHKRSRATPVPACSGEGVFSNVWLFI